MLRPHYAIFSGTYQTRSLLLVYLWLKGQTRSGDIRRKKYDEIHGIGRPLHIVKNV
jgi:hypothetical protein